MAIRLKMVNKGRRAYRINALLRYPRSGRIHGGIDIGMPIGTRLYAPMDGVVIARRDGVHNNRRGERIYSGKPSNWILLLVKIRSRSGKMLPAIIFLQHLSPGLAVHVGSRVKKGDYLGRSGNSGNSTGPHLHAGASWVRRGQKPNGAHRYDHVNSAALRVWPPSRYLGG